MYFFQYTYKMVQLLLYLIPENEQVHFCKQVDFLDLGSVYPKKNQFLKVSYVLRYQFSFQHLSSWQKGMRLIPIGFIVSLKAVMKNPCLMKCARFGLIYIFSVTVSRSLTQSLSGPVPSFPFQRGLKTNPPPLFFWLLLERKLLWLHN